MRIAFKLCGTILKPLDFDYGVIDRPEDCRDVLSASFGEFLYLKERPAVHKDLGNVKQLRRGSIVDRIVDECGCAK